MTRLAALTSVAQLPSVLSTVDTPSPAAGPVSAPVPRPSDLFTARLHPALRSAGMPVDSARRDWPADLLVSVLEQLQKDTPADILARWARLPDQSGRRGLEAEAGGTGEGAGGGSAED